METDNNQPHEETTIPSLVDAQVKRVIAEERYLKAKQDVETLQQALKEAEQIRIAAENELTDARALESLAKAAEESKQRPSEQTNQENATQTKYGMKERFLTNTDMKRRIENLYQAVVDEISNGEGYAQITTLGNHRLERAQIFKKTLDSNRTSLVFDHEVTNDMGSVDGRRRQDIKLVIQETGVSQPQVFTYNLSHPDMSRNKPAPGTTFGTYKNGEFVEGDEKQLTKFLLSAMNATPDISSTQQARSVKEQEISQKEHNRNHVGLNVQLGSPTELKVPSAIITP